MHKREVVRELIKEGVSERGACRAVGVHRSTFQHKAQEPDSFSVKIRDRVLKLAHRYRRYGVRRITALLRRQGYGVNRKRIHRLWKMEDLQVPRKRPRKRKNGISAPWPPQAAHPNHVWTYDFLFDRTESGMVLKFLAVLDEFTRESLNIRVGRTLDAKRTRETLERLFKERGAPGYIRSDNGPEFIAQELQEWLQLSGAQTLYIEPGHPWENGFAESFIGKLRDECLNEEVFLSVQEAQVVVDAWRQYYNHDRPHSSLGYRTPAEVALSSVGSSSPFSGSTTGPMVQP